MVGPTRILLYSKNGKHSPPFWFQIWHIKWSCICFMSHYHQAIRCFFRSLFGLLKTPIFFYFYETCSWTLGINLQLQNAIQEQRFVWKVLVINILPGATCQCKLSRAWACWHFCSFVHHTTRFDFGKCQERKLLKDHFELENSLGWDTGLQGLIYPV